MGCGITSLSILSHLFFWWDRGYSTPFSIIGIQHTDPGGHSLIWPIRGRAAGQGMVFGLSALNRVYNFMRTCPRQGMNLS